jgi:hypothetical protein
MRSITIVGLMLVAGCSDASVPAAQADGAAPNQAVTAAPGNALVDRVVSLGLTARQLEDAEIVDASGRELGDVERLVFGADGELLTLVVEIEDSDPDRFVMLPLEGLTVVQRGDDRDLQAQMTREQLAALPAAAR